MPFRTSLDALATAVSEPIEPDAAKEWLRNTEPFCRRGEGRWERNHRRLRRTFRDIEENDLSLAPCVSELRASGRSLTRRWARLCDRVQDQPEPALGSADESERAGHLKSDLQDWVSSARELDSAAITWLLESVYRERGISG